VLFLSHIASICGDHFQYQRRKSGEKRSSQMGFAKAGLTVALGVSQVLEERGLSAGLVAGDSRELHRFSDTGGGVSCVLQ
jgi:hypothetical protein